MHQAPRANTRQQITNRVLYIYGSRLRLPTASLTRSAAHNRSTCASCAEFSRTCFSAEGHCFDALCSELPRATGNRVDLVSYKRIRSSSFSPVAYPRHNRSTLGVAEHSAWQPYHARSCDTASNAAGLLRNGSLHLYLRPCHDLRQSRCCSD